MLGTLWLLLYIFYSVWHTNFSTHGNKDLLDLKFSTRLKSVQLYVVLIKPIIDPFPAEVFVLCTVSNNWLMKSCLGNQKHTWGQFVVHEEKRKRKNLNRMMCDVLETL